jgi:hypothetical protein
MGRNDDASRRERKSVGEILMKRLSVIVCVALLAGLTGPTLADVTYGLCWEFSGATSPAGPTLPWTWAEFEPWGDGDVMLTLSAENLVEQEFVRAWYFNVNDAALLGEGFAITPYDVPFDVNGIAWAEDDFKADGDGLFDICFDFATSGDRFGAGLAGSWIISHTGYDLDPEMFLAESASNGGGLYTAAHVQGIGPTGDESGWITIPAPGALLLGAIGLGVVARLKRWL